ncbi:MAG: hypothetical protein C4519_14855 [Desulfobacteraceae bacterium]|nr:MAG: hypothetical protein C4519_14855 [Desulfobacteraceae bacterium]
MELQDSFPHEDLPTKSELIRLSTGAFVRLQLKSGARFWCRVKSRQKTNGCFDGISDDSIGPIKRGDAVEFKSKHVLEIV